MKYLLGIAFLLYQAVASNDIPQYTRVVTFGDSTTDSGIAYRISNRTSSHVPPFNNRGGFVDDLVRNEVLTQKLLLNATLQNFACGSATADNAIAQGIMSRNANLVANYEIRSRTKLPGVRQQIDLCINEMMNKFIDFDRTLYMIWSGTNNYCFNKSLTDLDTVTSIIDYVRYLAVFDARNIAIINEPPVDLFPAFRNKAETATI
ncbi:unnamed protein product [Rotaria magnacalcarata]|uniref:Uncharacterized protein n=2 Tax=Rotaria magnacalcarata TaxID=392030 RepID=A0A8S2VJB5_9BILA|nr:unnamed protein product [Rotaria magnacalcarata]CAF5047753.1 unnamed protein product [Rotaria magnacalcarata]